MVLARRQNGSGQQQHQRGELSRCHDGAVPSESPLEVVAAVIEDAGLFLACRRRAGKAAAGKWEFPGGKIEPGESAPQALVREIGEELGIRVTGHLTTDDTAGIRLVCLLAALDGGRPTTSTDHDALKWVRRERLAELEWADADRPAVRLLTAAGLYAAN